MSSSGASPSSRQGAIAVLRPGLLASVQDLGRYGHRERGICPGGALDTLALTLANRLVGNPDGQAGLEITLGGCELRFDSETRIALVGDDFGAQLDGARAVALLEFSGAGRTGAQARRRQSMERQEGNAKLAGDRRRPSTSRKYSARAAPT